MVTLKCLSAKFATELVPNIICTTDIYIMNYKASGGHKVFMDVNYTT